MNVEVIAPRWIIPVRPRKLVLHDHALIMEEGKIQALLPQEEARTRYPNAAWTELPDHVLLPGLVNAHTHAAMNIMRGFADDLPLMVWLKEKVWPMEGKLLGEDYVRAGTRLAIAEMLRGGVTCFFDMYFYALAAAETASSLGMRAVVGHVLAEFPTPYASGPDDYLNKARETHAQIRELPLVRASIAPHAPYTVSDESFQKAVKLAEGLELPLQVHLHETASELGDTPQVFDSRPIARLDRLGVLNERSLAVHMTQLLPEEIALCAERGLHIAHCPESNQKLASGICPVASLLDAGVNVALGTDSAVSNNDLDMFGEMRSAAFIAKIRDLDATALPAWQVLEMATINGAAAMGLDQNIGSLEPGKAADLVAVDLGHPATQPVFNPVSQVVYTATRDQVSNVWVAGRRVVQNGSLTTMDWQEVKAETQSWSARVQTFAETL